MDKLSLNDFMNVQEQHKEVRKDDTPYVVHSYDGGVSVIGDSNKAEPKNPLSFKVDFRFLKSELNTIPVNAKEIGSFVVISRQFDDVKITGRNDTYLMEAMMGMYPLIRAFDEIDERKKEKIAEFNAKYNLDIDYATYVEGKDKLPQNAQAELEEILYQFNLAMFQTYNTVGSNAQDSAYGFVAKLLKIDKTLEDHMTGASVLSVISTIMKEYPEFFNETETVFSL